MHPSPNQTRLSIVIFSVALLALTFSACEMRLQIPSQSNTPDISPYQFEATGEDYLISALDEVQNIADWSDSFQNGLSARLSELSSTGKSALLIVTSTDTIYIYGQVITGGYGAVVTERYARPKGLLLITVRKTYGKANGHIVTETKRYASYADHRNDNPQQTNVTEMYGAHSDTIVTHVLRNGTLQTYTFRLPVITRVVNPQDGSIRVTSRYASNGEIHSKVTDGNGNLVQLRRTYGQTDGSTVTRTEYPDGSWTQVRTRGQADGTVLRETTSGLPTLGSGTSTPPMNIPRPVMSSWIRSLHEAPSDQKSICTGGCTPGYVPRPAVARSSVQPNKGLHWMLSRVALPPPPLPRWEKSFCSGNSLMAPKPPLPLPA